MMNSLVLTITLLGMSALPLRCISDGASGQGGCTFTGTVGPITIDLDVHWEVTKTATGKKLTVSNTTNETVEGCIVFRDAAGNTIGTIPAQIPPGGDVTVPIPPNTAEFHVANGADCGDSTTAPTGSVAAASAQRHGRRFHTGAQVVANTDGKPNVEDHITATSSDPAAFDRTVEHLIGFGYRGDFQVEPGVADVSACLTEVVVHPDNDIEITLAHNATFASVELWVNRVKVGDLTSAYRPPVVGTGWDAYSFLVPAALPGWNYNPIPGQAWSNDIELRFSKAGDPMDYALHRSVGFTSE